MSEILWNPSPEQIEHSKLTAFRRRLELQGHRIAAGYEGLRRWALAEPEEFWQAIWDFCEVKGARGQQIYQPGADMLSSKWFPEAMLNYAENLLGGGQAGSGAEHRPALVLRREDGLRTSWTYPELHQVVAKLRAALIRSGVQRGDRVVGLLPNIPEAVAAMLACASLGAIWSSCSPDFGVPGVVDRFGQIEAKVMFAADGYLYKNRVFDTRQKLQQILAQLPTVQTTVLIPYVEEQAEFEGAICWQDYLGESEPPPLTFEALPFDHPLYVMYSSGTTGKPKCIVHGHGGTLLQHLKEHQLHCDLRPGDRLFYFTTTGWMMWNWLVTGLSSGATLVLFDGNPFYPGPEALWRIVEQERVQVFGTSAKFLDACKKASYQPGTDCDLSALRAVLSTGSPLVAESFDWVYSEVKSDLQLSSISGGTDLLSCFVLGCPILPVRRGEVQCRGLGMDVEVWNDQRQELVGQAGELVCTQSFPSMPVGFWNDPDEARYRAAYFEYFPGIWRHGDWVELRPEGGMLIYGRSDATLNPGGVRIGTAEIYRQVEQFDQVLEAIVVGKNTDDGDQDVILFLKMNQGCELTDALREQIRQRIRSNATARHVPAQILAVDDIPRTRSGKISEIAVRDVLHGRQVKNVEALANPEALDCFRPS
jgi:acetoacetyl-CoA synthetase